MEKSSFCKNFKSILPDEMQAITEVTMSYKAYWRTVIHNLMHIYGEYANPGMNLKKYKKHSEYLQSCRKVKTLRGIPSLQFADIQAMIEEDRIYEQDAKRILSLREKLKNSTGETQKIVIKMASVLGLLPDNKEGMFSWLVNKKEMSEAQKKQFMREIDKNEAILQSVVEILSDLFLDGFLYEYDSVGAVMIQPHRKHFYRGESAFFGSSKPGIYRNMSEKETVRDIVLQKLRLDECCLAFDGFDVVRKWRYDDVNYLALAQHYGLKTNMIDVTSDLRTALFFACCKIGDDGKWRPLCKTDFEHKDSRKKELGLPENGDSRYGILHRSRTEITDLKWMIEESEWEAIVPVGYQPFMRCAAQSAYMLMAKNREYDLYKDDTFEKYKFRFTEELCDWIYREMDRGEKIYPYKDIPDIYNEVSAINDAKIFSENVYNLFMDDVKQAGYDDRYISDFGTALKLWGIEISKDKRVFEKEKIETVNKTYTVDAAEKMIHKHHLIRPLLIIT